MTERRIGLSSQDSHINTMKEKYIIKTEEYSFNIVQSRLESVRCKNIVKTGYRVYENGFIGVSGILGEADDEEGFKQARENLKLQIPYPYAPAEGIKKTRDLTSDTVSSKQQIEDLEAYLEECRHQYPDFIFSNKVNWDVITIELMNEKGTELINIDQYMSVCILLKHVDSLDIFESAIEFNSRNWDMELLKCETEKMLEGMQEVVELPEDAIILTPWELLAQKIVADLSGKAMGYKTSLFKDMMNEQGFNPQFSLIQTTKDDQLMAPFFDAEGTVTEEDIPLIENGRIVRCYTDKQSADQFGYECTGAADANYDDVPTLSCPNLDLLPTGKTVKELLDGRLGIILVSASGGDTSPSGHFATPVQYALLTDGEKMLGHLPEFQISGSIFDLFGKDYIGYSTDKLISNRNLLAVNAKIQKIN